MRMLKKLPWGVTALSVLLSLTGSASAFAAGPGAVDLRSADDFVLLAKTGISTTGSTSVVGDVGVSPAAATYMTGFALTLPAAGAFATSAQVNGKVYAPGYADPTPVKMTTAVSDMETAYTDAAGRTNPTATELGAGNIGGLTIAPGLYKWSTGVTIPTDVTLSGGANDVWIFQVAQNLTVSSAAKVLLSGGAQARNVFWAVAGQTTIGTTAVFQGTILDQTAIILNTGATLTGRALAQTAITLDSNTVTRPSSADVVSEPAPEPSPVVVSPHVEEVPPVVASPTSDESGHVGASPSSNEAAPVAVLIHDPAEVDTLLGELGETRSVSEEAKWEPLVHSDALAFKVGLTATQLTEITNFVTYGASAETKDLGAGERRAVIRDHLETVGHSDVNWEDIQRMTTGQKPMVRNLPKEQEKVGAVLAVFEKLVGHTPNFSVPKEDLAWNTLMYRVRFTRDLNKERAGIAKFQSLYKRSPSSPLDWAAVRAWGYVL